MIQTIKKKEKFGQKKGKKSIRVKNNSWNCPWEKILE